MFNKFFRPFLFILTTIYLILNTPAVALAAVTFSLSPAAKNLNVGDSFTANIMLDTGGQAVTGATAVLTYDPSKLSVIDASSALAGTQIGPGTVFLNPLSNIVDTVLGKITLDYGATQASFSGQGTFGTINFRALAQSAGTPVSFVITGGTSNSAVYSAGANVLSAATNGTYVITAAGAAQGGATPSALPQSGGVEETIFLIAASLIFLSGGFFLFRFSR